MFKKFVHWKEVLLSCIVIATFIITVNFYRNHIVMTKHYSLYNILDYYGFSTIEQKQALESLMRQASILAPSESIQDKFPNRLEYNDLVKDILEFVKLTQQYFTVRSGYQERWEVNPQEWMLKNQEEIFHNLKTLGMVESINPVKKIQDALMCQHFSGQLVTQIFVFFRTPHIPLVINNH
jgi:hypothetical protein